MGFSKNCRSRLIALRMIRLLTWFVSCDWRMRSKRERTWPIIEPTSTSANSSARYGSTLRRPANGSIPWRVAFTIASIISLPAQACAAGRTAATSVRPTPTSAADRLADHTRRKASGVFRSASQNSRTWLPIRAVNEVGRWPGGVELFKVNDTLRYDIVERGSNGVSQAYFQLLQPAWTNHTRGTGEVETAHKNKKFIGSRSLPYARKVPCSNQKFWLEHGRMAAHPRNYQGFFTGSLFFC